MMSLRRHGTVMLALVLLLGCEKKESTPESTSRATSSKATSTGAREGGTSTKGTSPKATSRTTTAQAPQHTTGRVHRIVLSERRSGGADCVVIDEPVIHVGYGDEVRWISKLKERVTVDVNGTSPLARGHFVLAPGGSDGAVVTYDSGQAGKRTFYYSVLPRDCAGTSTGPTIVVGGKE